MFLLEVIINRMNGKRYTSEDWNAINDFAYGWRELNNTMRDLFAAMQTDDNAEIQKALNEFARQCGRDYSDFINSVDWVNVEL